MVEKDVIEVAKKAGVSPDELVLYYGGDYQLLFTLRPEGLSLLSSLLGNSFTVIGKARAAGKNELKKDGHIIQLENRGYEHFRHG